MSAWTALTKPTSMKAIILSFIWAIIDNFDFLVTRIYPPAGIINGSFEEIDGDGNPVAWTIEEYGPTGHEGVVELDTAAPISGQRALKISVNSYGGSGGYARVTGDKRPIGPGTLSLKAFFKAVKTGGTNPPRLLIYILFYDKTGTYLSATTPVDVAVEQLWRGVSVEGIEVPGGARFYAVRVQGGENGNATDGYVCVDGIEVRHADPNCPVFNGQTYTTTDTSFETVYSFPLFIPDDATTLSITVDAKTESLAPGECRFLCNGNASSVEALNTNDVFVATTADYTLDAADKGKIVTVQIQARDDVGGGAGTVSIKMVSSAPNGYETKISIV